MVKQSKSAKSVQPATTKTKTSRSVTKRVSKQERAEAQVEAAEVRKGHKTGIILSVILAILVLIGAGFFIWYFAYYNQPAKVAADAVEDLIQSNDVMLKGGIAITPKNVDENGPQQITIDLSSSANQTPSTSNIDLMLIYQNGSVVKLNLGTIALQDGVAYLKIAGIMDSLEAADADEALRTYAYGLYSLFKLVDNEWWQISIPDLIAKLELPADDAEQLNETYSCIVGALQKDQSGAVADFYQQNQFVEVERTKNAELEDTFDIFSDTKGQSYYRTTLNYDNLAKFINYLPEAPVAKDVYACINDHIEGADLSASEFDETSADDLKDILPADSEIMLGISNWQHRLQTVMAKLAYDDYTMEVGLRIDHGAIAINLPESYRPLSDLIDELTEILSLFLTEPIIDAGEI